MGLLDSISGRLGDFSGSGSSLGGLGGALGGALESTVGPLLGAGGAPATNVPTSTLTPGQQGLLEQLVQALSGQIGQSGQTFQGDLPGASPLQQQGFDFASGIVPQAQQLFNQQLQPFDAQGVVNDFQPAADFAQRMFQQQTIPSITGGAAASGVAGSSSLNAALANAGGNLSSNIFSQIAPFVGQARNQHLEGPGRALQFGQGVAGLGAQQRNIGLGQFGEQKSQFEAADPFRNSALNLLPTALGQQSFENIVFPAKPSLFDQFAPVAAAFASGTLNAK